MKWRILSVLSVLSVLSCPFPFRPPPRAGDYVSQPANPGNAALMNIPEDARMENDCGRENGKKQVMEVIGLGYDCDCDCDEPRPRSNQRVGVDVAVIIN